VLEDMVVEQIEAKYPSETRASRKRAGPNGTTLPIAHQVRESLSSESNTQKKVR